MQEKIHEVVHALRGRTVIDATSGVGSFVTFDFSRHGSESFDNTPTLWIRHAAWRLETSTNVILTNYFEESFRIEAKKIISELNNLKVIKSKCEGICNDLTIEFENGFIFKTFTYFGNERKGRDSWEFFTHDNYLAEVGPGNIAKYIPSNSPIDDDD